MRMRPGCNLVRDACKVDVCDQGAFDTPVRYDLFFINRRNDRDTAHGMHNITRIRWPAAQISTTYQHALTCTVLHAQFSRARNLGT